jgi:hypothetical protein
VHCSRVLLEAVDVLTATTYCHHIPKRFVNCPGYLVGAIPALMAHILGLHSQSISRGRSSHLKECRHQLPFILDVFDGMRQQRRVGV